MRPSRSRAPEHHGLVLARVLIPWNDPRGNARETRAVLGDARSSIPAGSSAAARTAAQPDEGRSSPVRRALSIEGRRTVRRARRRRGRQAPRSVPDARRPLDGPEDRRRAGAGACGRSSQVGAVAGRTGGDVTDVGRYARGVGAKGASHGRKHSAASPAGASNPSSVADARFMSSARHPELPSVVPSGNHMVRTKPNGILLTALLLLGACRRADLRPPPPPASVSTITASIERLHGTSVRAAGFLNLELEGNALYPSQHDYLQQRDKTALWFVVPDSMVGQEGSYSGRCVVVDATVDAYNLGHRALFAGAIDRVTSVEVDRCSPTSAP